jgi:hypothetical protein
MIFVPFVKRTDARLDKLEADNKIIFEILKEHSKILKERSLKIDRIIELNNLKY